MKFSKVWDISCWFDLHDVSETHSQIFADGFIHADFSLLELVVDESNHQGFLSLFALDENGVSLEDFKLCHLGLAELN